MYEYIKKALTIASGATSMYDAIEQSKSETSDGGDRITVKEALAIAFDTAYDIAVGFGLEPTLDLREMPTKEDIIAIANVNGWRVIE